MAKPKGPTRLIFNNTPRIINTPRGVPIVPGGNEIDVAEFQAWIQWPKPAARRALERYVAQGNLTGPATGHNPREKRLPRKLAVNDRTGAQIDARRPGQIKRDFLTKGSVDRELLAEVQGRAAAAPGVLTSPVAPSDKVEIVGTPDTLKKFSEHVGAVSEILAGELRGPGQNLSVGYRVPAESLQLIDEPPEIDADDAPEDSTAPARPRSRTRSRRPDPVESLTPEARAALGGRPAEPTAPGEG